MLNLCYNFFIIEISVLRKKNNKGETLAKHVTWENHYIIAKFRILKALKGQKKKKKKKKNQKCSPFGKFVTEVLIFRISRSQMFFKIGVLKNLAILEPVSNKNAGLLLQNTCGGCFSIFAAANTFFQRNSVFIADSPSGFVSGSFENLRSSHWSCSVKKMFLEILQISQGNTCDEADFWPTTLLKRDSNTDVFLWNFRNFQENLI